ncbi:MAG TPA: peptidoglycan-binding domain-containing protein, partial [Planctomycetota bacterium]|nr:peptidoglycan-binding domain-containing protein [Planctomycetota bacterium]
VMFKRFAIALALGCGLAAGTAVAQQNPDTNRNPNQNQNQDQNGYGTTDPTHGFQQVPKGVLEIPQGQVQRIRDALGDKGYKAEGGKFDTLADLSGSIRRFQQAQGLPVTGKLDLQTVKALGLDALVVVDPDVKGAHFMLGEGGKNVGTAPAGLPKGTPIVGFGKSPVGYIVLGSDQIDKIQDQLVAEGYIERSTIGKIENKVGFNGGVDAKFVDAVRRFQRAHGIQSDGGLLDVATLAAMPKLDINADVAQNPAIQLPTSDSYKGSKGLDRGNDNMKDQNH